MIKTVLKKIRKIFTSSAKKEQTSIPKEEIEIFNLLKDKLDVVFDVGARDDLSFYHIKKNCSYHLFEPNVKFINSLKNQISLLEKHNIKLNEFGLSDEEKDNCIYYEKSQSFIINPTFQQGDIDTGKRYSIRTLDRYVAEHNISHIDYLKIDAEGLDYKIILGGRDTIQNNKISYIQFEYWDGIKKFVDVLQNYKLYLMMEPMLLKAITKIITPMMTPEEKQIDFHKSIIEVTDTLINLIDFKIIPTGNGGNVLGINKNISHLYTDKLVFDITNKNNTLLLLKKYIPLSIKEALKKIYPIGNLRLSLSDITAYIKNIFKKKLSTEEIAKYRKTIKIYDIFTFFNELELLEIRLNILDKYVDHFVIVEATETFSGLPKPLYFEQNKKKFEKWKDKIIHYVVDDYPNDKELCAMADLSPNVPKGGPQHWHREFYQKETIKKALLNLSDDDICFVSDVDEIWNPEVKIDYTKNDIFKLRQDVYVYYLNNRSSEPWAGTLVTKYKNIKNNCLNHLRTASKTKYTYIKNGGWHFTNMGGVNEIRKKLNASYTSESYNTSDVQSKLEERIRTNKDYIGRKFDYMGRAFTFWVDESDLPKYLLDNKEKYKKFFK